MSVPAWQGPPGPPQGPPPGGPYGPQGGYPPPPPPPPKQKRTLLPWLLGSAALLVVLIVVLVIVLTTGGDDDEGGGVLTGGDSSSQQDLSSPEAAARTFVEVLQTNDVDAVLEISCAQAKQEGAPPERMERVIKQMGAALSAAEFGESREASEPGMREVPYTLEQTGDSQTESFLMFKQEGGKWLWCGAGGSSNPNGPGANGPEPPGN
ncbi:hypothetical protein EV191_106112 [Tamaricihabitans halophyticus]|uniref:DUF4878 domain-containing protein n=1 Tax=Tamaricihabitans halophyticus TaxID=1262583 RepID=A0A4R2QTA9_9PSEU|nr:hypothetical protein [Tamaricihabitans halophyticus]TCP51948.1 hypothetical protein EV191_106112 [Tamaricihabitans halophyticus]